MIPYEVGVQELQVLRTAFDSSLLKCYLEGRYLVYVSVIHLAPKVSHPMGVFFVGVGHGREGMERGLSYPGKCMS